MLMGERLHFPGPHCSGPVCGTPSIAELFIPQHLMSPVLRIAQVVSSFISDSDSTVACIPSDREAADRHRRRRAVALKAALLRPGFIPDAQVAAVVRAPAEHSAVVGREGAGVGRVPTCTDSDAATQP